MWILKGLAVLAALIVLGVGVLLGLLRDEHRAETRLPTPTGPYAVGRSIYTWTDAAHTDKLAPMPGTPRELVAWIWYPAPKYPMPNASPGVTADYLPAAWRAAVEQARGALISKFITRDLSRVRVHSMQDPDLSPEQQTYPVVIMRAGLAALTAEYTVLAEDLASHGYIVVGFDAPFRTAVMVFSDGRVVSRTAENNPELVSGPVQEKMIEKLLAAWSSDMGFALDQLERLNAAASGRFAGRLDLQHVGVFGHSLGGATAAQFCHEDSRCKAGIDVDGAPYGSVIREGLHQPFMFLVGEHGAASDPDTRRIDADIQSIYDRLPPEGRWWVTIRGANHFGFSDGVLVKSQRVQRLLHLLGIIGIDGRQQLSATAYYVHSFFDMYLKDAPASVLQNPPARYPVRVVTAANSSGSPEQLLPR
ncbi:alpha/beta hydrolase family protein [Dyella tabacisoli]|uniref:Family membership n=1 Tax=Dyella tabacisoli TaxID=2282381 RepID=A0A369UQ05_9GAMM|nr:family membership [Dyella tabacisoli]RDD80409.1 family membership [Dyella tabacisoli]